MAERRARNTHRHQQQRQQVNSSQGTSASSCDHMTGHVALQPAAEEQELVDAAIAWQLQATWGSTEPDRPDMPCQVPFDASLRSLTEAATSSAAAADGFSYDAPSCDDGSLEYSGSLDSMTDAELEAMIEDELLLAAAALPSEQPAGAAGCNAGMHVELPAVAPMHAEPAAAAASDASAMQRDAQNARLHSLLGRLAELSATLQQLQQAVGLHLSAESGSVMTGYAC
jgi:hypothetical protein